MVREAGEGGEVVVVVVEEDVVAVGAQGGGAVCGGQILECILGRGTIKQDKVLVVTQVVLAIYL
jgi:hypothetical protein